MGTMEADYDNGDRETCALHAYYNKLTRDFMD